MGLTEYGGVHYIHLALSGSEREQASGCENIIEWELFSIRGSNRASKVPCSIRLTEWSSRPPRPSS
jgi:hypothetical protein